MARVWLGPAGVELRISQASIRAKSRSEFMRRFCAGVGVCCANMLSTFIAASPGTVPFPRTTTAKIQRATAPVARANSDAESVALLANHVRTFLWRRPVGVVRVVELDHFHVFGFQVIRLGPLNHGRVGAERAALGAPIRRMAVLLP